MKTTIKRIARLLASPEGHPDRDVHFHGGGSGPYVCENARCTSPALDVP